MYLNILLIILAIGVAVLVVYLVLVLIQLKRNLKSVDTLTQQVTKEVEKVDSAIENIKTTSDHLKNITGKVAGFSFLKVLTVLSSVIKGLNFLRNIKGKKSKKEKENNKE